MIKDDDNKRWWYPIYAQMLSLLYHSKKFITAPRIMASWTTSVMLLAQNNQMEIRNPLRIHQWPVLLIKNYAGQGHTPHDALNAIGRHLIEKTGDIAAVQRQLGYTNAVYYIKYVRVTDEELAEALDDQWSAFDFSSVTL